MQTLTFATRLRNPRIGQVVDAGAGALGNHLGEITHAVGFSHLVEDLHSVAGLGGILQCDLNALHGVLDMDDG